MPLNGTILKIERYAIHDGPGIRTVVFLKGCPLQCAWCSSPESWNISPEIGYDAASCNQCKSCVEICPAKAIRVTPDDAMVTDIEYCRRCGECAAVCPALARKLIGEMVSVDQVLHEIEKDSVFYHRSSGGITLSGGEPTMQLEFSKEILRGCIARGFHTAIETCGCVKWEKLNTLLPYLDLIYVDIKHISTEIHKNTTGQGNELILSNIEDIDEQYPNLSLIIRVPVIPSVNDSHENIENTAKFVANLKHVKRIELLPYHNYGLAMYGALDKKYTLKSVKPPKAKDLDQLTNIIRSFNIPVQMGG